MNLPELLTGAVVAIGAVVAGSTVAQATHVAPPAGGCFEYHDNNQYPLQRCDKGDTVRVLQTALHVVDPGLDVDGYFGVATEAALRLYEQTWGATVGLAVDGIADAQTWASLTWQHARGDDANQNGAVDPWEIVTAPAPAPVTCSSYRADYAFPIQLCGRGEAVRVVQIGLLHTVAPGLAADGYFGPATLAALTQFQQEFGLTTGEIDAATWYSLTNHVSVGVDANGSGRIEPWEVTGTRFD